MAKNDNGAKITDKIVEGTKNAGKAMKDAATKTSENAFALNGRIIDHAEENTRSAFAALRSAASVKSVQDLTKIQSEFVKEQSARSMAQIKEVGDLIAQFGKDTMAALRPKD